MEIRCPACELIISYEGEPPKFCHQCGHSLVVPSPSTHDDADVTLAPTTQPQPSDDAGEGDRVGPFQLVRWLGAGGMGVVWEAIDTTTGRSVALKRLSRAVAADEKQVQRFLREGQLAAQISNPNVTFIYAAGEHDGQPFIAMELMPGHTLADRVKQSGAMPVTDAVDSMLDVIEGLEAAHRLGLIHRDVKPSNCFLDSDDRSVKVGDFGLSKSLVATDSNLTQTGTFLGTPSYAAPEQIRSGDLDERTDIYAVGATLFNLLSGRTPFEGDAMSVTAQIITDEAPSVQTYNEQVPSDLNRVIARCLEKDPAKRFPDLDQLRLALVPFATGRHSLATIGRRMAAYMIDIVMIQLISAFILGSFGALIGMQSAMLRSSQADMQERIAPFTFWSGLIVWFLIILYFAISEGCFGRSMGKRLMGLRVVDGQGQRPGFWRGLLRAFILPGYAGLGPFYLTLVKPAVGATSQVLIGLQSTLVNLVPLGICASTMRTRNQFRGLHEFISGTRVTRLQTSKRRLPVPIVLPQSREIEKQKFGPFETRKVMGRCPDGNIFLGRDLSLDRDVWIVVLENAPPPSLERVNLARMARQRWLEGETLEESGRWDAFEAVEGIPIQKFVSSGPKADWQDYRQMLLDLAVELSHALDDNTLPDKLSMPQVWVDREGHAKILDRELIDLVQYDGERASDLATGSSTKNENAVQLLKDVARLLSQSEVFPVSAQEFLSELDERPCERKTLHWAVERLENLKSDIGSLAWDTRVGILGVTMGTEFPAYYFLAGILFLFTFNLLPIPNAWKLFTGVCLGIFLPAVMGYVFAGGPIFRFMGIQVCNKKGRPAKRITSAFRNLISWLPAIIFAGVFLTLLVIGETNMSNTEPTAGSYAAFLKENPISALFILGAAGISSLIMVLGMITALTSPKRGLVDRILGTQLMPK